MASNSTNRIVSSPFDQSVTFIYVRDLDAATYFYQKVLQLPLALTQKPPATLEDIVRIFAITSTSFIGLCKADPTSKNGTGVTIDGIIFTLVTDSVDEWGRKLVEEGVVLEKGPVFNERYNIYHVFFRDPDGHLLEIQQFRDPDWPRVESQFVVKSQKKNHIFNLIYGDMPYIKIGQGDLTNGEITSEKTMKLIFDLIEKHGGKHQFDKVSSGRFYDLGSGIGKPVIASALVCDWLHEFVGIEIQNDLYEKSLQAKDRFNTLTDQKHDASIIKLHLGSFFEIVEWMENGDVIFINSTGFSQSMMRQLFEYLLKCKTGCYIITLTHNLVDIEIDENVDNDSNFVLLNEFRQEMSWGAADFFLHFKIK